MKLPKTNAARLLDKEKIHYELIPYVVDENKLGATHIASQLNEPIERVFKTIVLQGDKSGYFVCVIPGAEEINLKKAAKITCNKKCDLIPLKELLSITGYIRGGCSPIGMKKAFSTYIHQSCMDYDSIFISAGIRGLQFQIAPASLISVTHAVVADLID